MKRIILPLLLALATFTAADAKKVYAELLGFQKGLFSTKVKVRVDFGQNVSFWKRGDMILVDKDGKDLIFNSMVDAMNFMGSNGWEFVQAYVVTEGSQNVYHWLMTKDVNSDEEIKAGFNVRADNEPKESLPSYTITFLKKSKKATQWEVANTISKHMASDEAAKMVEEWKSQTNDNYDYDCQIKKN